MWIVEPWKVVDVVSFTFACHVFHDLPVASFIASCLMIWTSSVPPQPLPVPLICCVGNVSGLIGNFVIVSGGLMLHSTVPWALSCLKPVSRTAVSVQRDFVVDDPACSELVAVSV